MQAVSLAPFFCFASIKARHSTFQLRRSVPSRPVGSQCHSCVLSRVRSAPLIRTLCQFLASETPNHNKNHPAPALPIRAPASLLPAAACLPPSPSFSGSFPAVIDREGSEREGRIQKKKTAEAGKKKKDQPASSLARSDRQTSSPSSFSNNGRAGESGRPQVRLVGRREHRLHRLLREGAREQDRARAGSGSGHGGGDAQGTRRLRVRPLRALREPQQESGLPAGELAGAPRAANAALLRRRGQQERAIAAGELAGAPGAGGALLRRPGRQERALKAAELAGAPRAAAALLRGPGQQERALATAELARQRLRATRAGAALPRAARQRGLPPAEREQRQQRGVRGQQPRQQVLAAQVVPAAVQQQQQQRRQLPPAPAPAAAAVRRPGAEAPPAAARPASAEGGRLPAAARAPAGERAAPPEPGRAAGPLGRAQVRRVGRAERGAGLHGAVREGAAATGGLEGRRAGRAAAAGAVLAGQRGAHVGPSGEEAQEILPVKGLQVPFPSGQTVMEQLDE